MFSCSLLVASERPTSTRRRRSGVAATELAICAPFLAIIMMGMFEISRAVMVVEMLDDAARKGCNTGIKPGKSYTNISNDVNNIMTDNGITVTPTFTVEIAKHDTPQPNPPTWGGASPVWTAATSNSNYTPKQFDLVRVQVSIPAASVLWFSPSYLTGSAGTLYSSKVVMMRAG